MWALADERLLDQSVGNILANCLRYARRVLTVSLRAESGRVCIRIADDGSGISPADLPHLFERFYKGGGGHAGLGLAIARAAVSLMGGTLTAQNDAQTGGAVFLLCLPAASPPPTGLSPAPRGR